MTDEIEAKRRLDTDDRRIWLLQQYYAVLNEQPDFRAALAQLVDDVGEAAHEADSSAAPRSFWDAWNEPRIDDPSEDFIRTGARSMPADVRARLEVFADQWRLPRPNAVVDLWLILLRTRGDGSPGLPDPWPVFKMRPLTGARKIWPARPVPFEYVPEFRLVGWIEKYADEVARTVHDSIMQQAEEADRAAQVAGWKTIGPWRHKEGMSRRLALRLYRAAVLGMDWESIADAEADDDKDPDGEWDAQSVRLSVQRWARELVLQ